MSKRAVASFIFRRLLALVFLLVLISFVVFSLLYLAPGDPIQILLGTNVSTPQTIALLRHEYHLDEPYLTQYWIWVTHALQLDFGNSVETTLPVTDEIKSRLPTSLFLGIYAYALTMVLGVGLGIAAALRKRSAMDRGIVAGSLVMLSTPAFVGGVLLIYLFAIVLPWFPVFGKGVGFWDQLWHLTLPAVTLSLAATAFLVKHTRAAVINVLDQDYVVFARARGLSNRRVLLLYGLRNALIPVVTVSAVLLAHLITGAVLVEVTFSLFGIGSLLVHAVTVKDLPMVQGVTMLFATVVLLANLLADLAYLAIDPRIRFGRRSA